MGLEDDIQRKADEAKRRHAAAVSNKATALQRYDRELARRWDELEENLARIALLLMEKKISTEKIFEQYIKLGMFSDSIRTRHAANGWQVRNDLYLDNYGRLWEFESERGNKKWKLLKPSSMDGYCKSQPYKFNYYDVLLPNDGLVWLYHDYSEYRGNLLGEISDAAANIIARGGGPNSYRPLL